MEPVEIREASTNDLSPLAKALAPLELFRRYNLGPAALEKRWRGALERGEGLVVALAHGRLAGICWFIARGAFGTAAYLRTLAVAEEAQGSGVGARLLHAFEERTQSPSGGWVLLASDFNDGAQRFYQRHGYREVGRMPDFAAPGVTEVILWKPAPAP